MAPVFTLVPSEFFAEETARDMLSEVVPLKGGEPLSFIEIPAFKAVMVYVGDRRPEVYGMLMSVCKVKEYNKILISFNGGWLNLVLAQGDSLLLCNTYTVPDFTTALYYLFAVMKKFQINPEISTVYFMGELKSEEVISLCNYFKSAEALR